MRIDGYHPLAPFFVWDAERCCTPRMIAWVDDETNEYKQWIEPLVVVGSEAVHVIVKCRKIVINLDRRTIIINPVDDDAELQEIARHFEVTL
jgi:hypothetical protein